MDQFFRINTSINYFSQSHIDKQYRPPKNRQPFKVTLTAYFA